jgi:hypothetical protein
MTRAPNIHEALSVLRGAIRDGEEFPDIAHSVARSFRVNQDELEAMYDKACEERVEYTCPECGGYTFKISVTRHIDIAFLPNGNSQLLKEGGDAEFDRDSLAECTDCGFFGKLRDMQ